MKTAIITSLLLASTLQVVSASETVEPTGEANAKEHAAYQDYKWDIGLVGSMIADGLSGDKRLPTELGLHGAYHWTNNVSIHAEYLETLTVIAENDNTNNTNTDRIVAASVAYDFSPERVYSLYAKAGLGYEGLSNDNENKSDVVTLIGAGGRYMFTDNIGGYVEGRWKYGFNESGNALMGVAGIDYSFGNAK